MIEEGILKLDLVRWFSKIDSNSIDSVGEKGAKLGELFNNRFPIPNGFVVTTESYSYFLNTTGIDKKIDAILDDLDVNDFSQIQKESERIKSLIVGAEFPEDLKEEILDSYSNLGTNKVEIEKGSAFDILNSASESVFVSVRSSLSFDKVHKTNNVREQNTYLNVKGNDSLISHIKSCFASLFNPITIQRALKSNNMNNFKIAVVIQKMIDSQKSGDAKSKDEKGNISLRAIWGLGEGINLENPQFDEYILSKELDIVDKRIVKKDWYVVRDSAGMLKMEKCSLERSQSSVLNNYEIQRIGDFAEKIENHFNKPQEIEFAIDETEIYIMQARDLQVVEKEEKIQKVIVEEEKVNPEIEKVKEEIKENEKKLDKEIESIHIRPVEKITKTKLKLDLFNEQESLISKKTGLKKVGIFRIEDSIKAAKKHPLFYLKEGLSIYGDLVYSGIDKICENFEEVWVRLSDFNSLDFSQFEGLKGVEENPLLGLHGIRFLLKYPGLLKEELNAIKKLKEKGVEGILIPNIISISELEEFKKYLFQIGIKDIKLGVIIETPAAVQLIKDFCQEELDLISIDLGHLIQYLLAVDLGNNQVSDLANQIHPALLYQLEYMLRVIKRNEIQSAIYGEGIKNEEILNYLIKKGADFIFVRPEDASIISEKIFSFEKEIYSGTDSEPRKYELNKTKEEYVSPVKVEKEVEEKKLVREIEELTKEEGTGEVSKEELKEIVKEELEKEESVESENEGEVSNEEENLENEEDIPKTEEELKQDLELIEKEKKEYLDEHPEEGDNILKENSKEEFDEDIENLEEDLEKESLDNSQEIEDEEKNDDEELIDEDEIIGETLEGEENENTQKKEKDDPLGIF